MLPVAKLLCSRRRTVWERLLGRIIAGNRYAPSSLSSLSVNVRMTTLTTIRCSVV